jgi:hypothetical protein
MTNLRSFLAVIALSLCTLLTACSSNALTAAAKIEAATSLGCSTAFTIVSQANTAGLVSTADATAVITQLLVIEQVNQQAENATAAIAAAPTSTNSSAANVLAIVQPIATAVDNAVAGGFVGIKDAGTKQKVLLAITTAQTAITGALAIIKAVKQ